MTDSVRVADLDLIEIKIKEPDLILIEIII